MYNLTCGQREGWGKLQDALEAVKLPGKDKFFIYPFFFFFFLTTHCFGFTEGKIVLLSIKILHTHNKKNPWGYSQEFFVWNDHQICLNVLWVIFQRFLRERCFKGDIFINLQNFTRDTVEGSKNKTKVMATESCAYLFYKTKHLFQWFKALTVLLACQCNSCWFDSVKL